MSGTNAQTKQGVPPWIVHLAIAAAVIWTLFALRQVLTPVFFAFLLAYMLSPVVDWLEAHKVNRSVAVLGLLLAIPAVGALILLLVIPAIAREVAAFVADLPEAIAATVARLEPQLARLGISVPHTLREVYAQLPEGSGELAKQAMAPVSGALKWVLGGTASVIGAVASLIIIPVFGFYLLRDFGRITAAIYELIPPGWRRFVVDVTKEVDTVLGSFIRGQLLVMAILAGLYSLAYGLLGVRLALVIGVIAGLIAFIPYVGGAVALALALLMTLLAGEGAMQFVWVTLAYTVIQLLEGFVITPRVMGETVGLSPLWVLFALMVGGELFGFLGILLALPVAAVAKIFAIRGLATYRESAFFSEARPASGESRILTRILAQPARVTPKTPKE